MGQFKLRGGTMINVDTIKLDAAKRHTSAHVPLRASDEKIAKLELVWPYQNLFIVLSMIAIASLIMFVVAFYILVFFFLRLL